MSSTTKNQTTDAKKGQDNNNKEELSDLEKESKQKMEKNSKKAVPKSKHIKDDSESDEEDDEENDDDDEELKPGLLDLPLEVTGARERKKVERLALSFHQPSKDKKAEIAEGKGTKLGECPRIEHQLQKMRVDDLKPLHKLLFNRPGAPNEIKKNIRRFSGFVFDKDGGEFEKKKNSLDKLTNAILKKMCEVLDLERSGTKDDIVTRILDFLLKPEPTGKKLPKSKNAKKSSTNKTKKVKNSSAAKNSKKGDDEMKSESGSEDEDDDKNEDEDEDVNDVKKDEDDETKKNVETKVEVVEKSTKKADNKTKGKNKRKNSSESESSDDEPLVKKNKMPPTDDELKDFIKSILDGANLEEITMKTVCKQVYAKFPEFDLSSRKEFIKSTVRSIIS